MTKIAEISVHKGCMKASKTSAALLEVASAAPFGESVLGFKWNLDNRYAPNIIQSRNFQTLPAISVENGRQIVIEVAKQQPEVVMIDEAQFIEGIGDAVQELRFSGIPRLIVVSLLSEDYRGEKFGEAGDILAIANRVAVHSAKCGICHLEATHTQRYTNGEPSSWYEQTIAVDNGQTNYTYEPVCDDHWRVRDRPVFPGFANLLHSKKEV